MHLGKFSSSIEPQQCLVSGCSEAVKCRCQRLLCDWVSSSDRGAGFVPELEDMDMAPLPLVLVKAWPLPEVDAEADEPEGRPAQTRDERETQKLGHCSWRWN